MERGIAAELGLAMLCAILLPTCEMSLVQTRYYNGNRPATQMELVLWDRLNKPGLPVSEVENILTGVIGKENIWIGGLTVQQVLDYKNYKQKSIVGAITLEQIVMPMTGTESKSFEYCQPVKVNEMDVSVFMEKTSRISSGTFQLVREENAGVRTFAQYYRKEIARWCREHIRDVVKIALDRIGGESTLKFFEHYRKKYSGQNWMQLPAPNSKCITQLTSLKVNDRNFYGNTFDEALTEDWREVIRMCMMNLNLSWP